MRLRIASLMDRLARDERGSMVIETAIVVPVLALMSIGTFEVSGMVARQNELQAAASEAAQVILATPTGSQVTLSTVKQIIQASTGLPSDKVTVGTSYRCGTDTTLLTTSSGCDSNKLTTYMTIYLTDTYTPAWTHFGVGSAMTYRVTRRVVVS